MSASLADLFELLHQVVAETWPGRTPRRLVIELAEGDRIELPVPERAVKPIREPPPPEDEPRPGDTSGWSRLNEDIFATLEEVGRPLTTTRLLTEMVRKGRVVAPLCRDPPETSGGRGGPDQRSQKTRLPIAGMGAAMNAVTPKEALEQLAALLGALRGEAVVRLEARGLEARWQVTTGQAVPKQTTPPPAQQTGEETARPTESSR